MGNDIFVMEISAPENIGECNLRSLTEEESLDLVFCLARLRLNKFHPPKATFVECADLLQVGFAATAIEPANEAEEAAFHRQGAWLIDEALSGRERQDVDFLSVAMCVAGGLHRNERSWIAAVEKFLMQRVN